MLMDIRKMVVQGLMFLADGTVVLITTEQWTVVIMTPSFTLTAVIQKGPFMEVLPEDPFEPFVVEEPQCPLYGMPCPYAAECFPMGDASLFGWSPNPRDAAGDQVIRLRTSRGG
jgi:hypothetical protein